MQPEIRVIGVGNVFRGDDAAGLEVARKIREMHLPRVLVLESGGGAGHLTQLWEDRAPAILIDAVQSGAKPGLVYRFDAAAGPIPTGYFPAHSTHSLGVVESIELARVLNQLPACLIVFGIEGKSFEPGGALSPEVAQAMPEVVRRVVLEVQKCRERQAVVE
jgi:hydrogenase maturation protease